MAEKKKKTKWARQPLVLSALKKLFVRSPMYKAVKDAAKVPYTAKKKDGSDSKAKRFQYRCAICKQLFFDKKETIEFTDKRGKKKTKKVHLINIDHINPVIDIDTGYTTVDNWIDREFVGVEVWDTKINTFKELEGKLQLLCVFCHNIKSNLENAHRREVKKGKQ